MARSKLKLTTTTQAILRRLEPEIDGFSATIPMAIVVATMKFHDYLWQQFAEEFSGEDHLEWDVLRGWLMLKEMDRMGI